MLFTLHNMLYNKLLLYAIENFWIFTVPFRSTRSCWRVLLSRTQWRSFSACFIFLNRHAFPRKTLSCRSLETLRLRSRWVYSYAINMHQVLPNKADNNFLYHVLVNGCRKEIILVDYIEKVVSFSCHLIKSSCIRRGFSSDKHKSL